MNSSKLVQRYRVTDGRKFRLKDFDAADTAGISRHKHAARILEDDIVRLRVLQDKLYAQDRWAVLLIFQGMDAAGKDSTINHVLSGVNPQGCEVFSFKQPSEEELDHDYMWRALCRLPRRRHIGIFNRSYYEEVLVARVHPEVLQNERIPPSLMGKDIWDERFTDIRAVEQYLSRNGTVIRKFFLHLSRKEQKQRFLARLEEPEKNWKFSLSDIQERGFWDGYVRAYEEMIRQTATPYAPWHVVPADNKWFARLVVAAVVVETLQELHPEYPAVDKQRRAELQKVRKVLERA
jgi:PPK2 family polyphosphate:nucleotide phosphotransferase